VVGGPGQFLLEGPYDVMYDVIVCRSYVFADSQGPRLFFPVVENVLTQMHIQLAARSTYRSVFLLKKIFHRLENDSAGNNIHPNNKQKPEITNKNIGKRTCQYGQPG